MIDPYTGRPSFSPVRKSYTVQAESQLRERVAMLQKEFADIDANHDQWISREELYSYLDRKSGKTFERAIADDIFDQMDKDHDNKVTINEFIKVYIQADEILRAKIDKARLMRETFKKEEEELKIKAQQAAAREGYGAPQGGLANVNVKEVRLAPELRTNSLFVEVYLNHNPVAKTKVISAESALIWDEKFAFEVPNASSEIKFVLFDRGAFGGIGGATALGEARVNVSELSDQELHSAWVNLLKKEGQAPAGHLSLELQWIYSKAKYFHALAHRSHDNAEKADEDVRDFEDMLVKLHEPFGGMQTAHQAFDVQSKYPGLSTRDQQFVSGMNKLATKLGHGTTENVWSKIAIIIATIEAIIGILLMFGRGSFFDVLFPIMVILYIRQGSFSETISLRIVALMFILSVLVQDLLWALVFWEDWGFNEIMAFDLPSHQMTFIILLTIISMGVKVLLAILCYMVHIQTSMHRGSVKRNMMRNVDYQTGQVSAQNTIL